MIRTGKAPAKKKRAPYVAPTMEQVHNWLVRHFLAQESAHKLAASRPLGIRVEPLPRMAALYALPLSLCEPRNRARGPRQAWQEKLARDRCLVAMRANEEHFVCMEQAGDGYEPFVVAMVQGIPYPVPDGVRPRVCCVRYSITEPDYYSNWAKIAVDCLQPSGVRTSRKTGISTPYKGLGIIRSDSPDYCDVREWWEPAPRGDGFAIIEVTY